MAHNVLFQEIYQYVTRERPSCRYVMSIPIKWTPNIMIWLIMMSILDVLYNGILLQLYLKTFIYTSNNYRVCIYSV